MWKYKHLAPFNVVGEFSRKKVTPVSSSYILLIRYMPDISFIRAQKYGQALSKRFSKNIFSVFFLLI